MTLLDYIHQAHSFAERSPSGSVAGLKKVTIHVDGACHPNPGRGGWGALLRYGRHEKRLSGRIPEEPTTSPRSELHAAIKALEALREPCEVRIYSDSAYVVQTMLGEYGRRSNVDLWEMLDAVAAPHKVSWAWVRSHAGNRGNEIAHRLAEVVA